MRKKGSYIIILLIFLLSVSLFMPEARAQVTVSGSTGANGNYTSLTNAAGAFLAINGNIQTGNNIVITITGNSIAEAGTNSLNAGTWTSLTIYPTTTGLTISGTVAAPLINLNGADNVTIDGRVNASGSTTDLTISNLSTSNAANTSTIRFINDASSNTIKYCTLRGSTTNAASGILFFSTGGSTGNDANTIDNNNITNSADANRPLNAIHSAGTVVMDNDGNIVSNNNIYNFLNRSTASNGIHIPSNSTTWSITGNSFYETAAPFIPTASVAYNVININNAAGNGFTISGNYIGGSAASCSGTWTKTNVFNNTFNAIQLNVGTTTATSVQDNTIRNFAWSNSTNATWTGISVVAGDVNIGTSTGNTIGATTGNGSIAVTNATIGANLYGINIASSGTVSCQNNQIGSITGANAAANATNIYGINKTAVAGTTTIINNTIGSATDANSINANSTSTGSQQNVYGIFSAGTGSITINGNTIANLTNATNNANVATTGSVNGIASIAGTDNTISNNSIHDLTIANANNLTNNTASVCGIALSGATLRTVSGNTIYNLSNAYASFAGNVIGLYFSGSTGGNIVDGNFIYNLSVNPTSNSASIFGIKMVSGATTYSNNIISLGGNTTTTITGIYETGAAGNNNNLYFNTVYIGGVPNAGALWSYAFHSAVSTNIRNFRNNIFDNARSNNGATGKHYAAYFAYAVNTNITLDYNDYYAPGTGGVLGYYAAADKPFIPIVTGGIMDANSQTFNPLFANPGGTSPGDYLPAVTTFIGVTGTGITTDYYGTVVRGTPPAMGAIEFAVNSPVRVAATLGTTSGFYNTVKAAFDKINDGTHKGAITITLYGSTAESAAAVLNASGSGSASYSSVLIYPTVTGVTIAGSLATPLIDLNGASNVTIDGRVNATGSTKDLTITNLSTSNAAGTSTIRFINDASSNTIRYCTLEGSSTNATSGILFFSTAALTGNSGNTIDNNNITNATDAIRPLNAIYSAGTALRLNSSNTISNNNIYDFLNRGTISNGINIAANSNTWSITGNSFYETASFAPTGSVAYNVIYINNASGTGFTIIGNFIGGNTASCGGTPWSKTAAFDNIFNAIQLNVGSITATSVQNNTISNFAWSNSLNGNWTGINVVAGDINIGTATGNTIGSGTGTGSITVTSTTTGSNFYGIYIASIGTVSCQNNAIGSVTAANISANFASNIYGIYKALAAGTTTINNNTIGSTATANSINATSASAANAQSVYGINNAGNGLVTIISGNTVANLTNGTTNTTAATPGAISGIFSNNGTNIVSNNTIRDLTIANANNSATFACSVSGIALSVTSLKTVTGNTIYNLSNSYNAFAGSVIGLYFAGSAGANSVSNNFIHSLSVNAASTTASIYGIKVASGATTYSNNIINLGGNTPVTIYGIYEDASFNNNNLYFNTVYVSGSLTAGITNKSYALYSNVASNSRDFRNNIFMNARSTTGGASLHYAAFFNYNSSAGLTLNYNDYFVTGTGGVLGRYNNLDVLSTPLIAGMDANSLNTNPNFTSAGGTAPLNYYPSATLPGATNTGITGDFYNNPRIPSVMKMGALEANQAVPSNTVDVYIGAAFQASYIDLHAAFDKINDGTHQGNLILKITGSQSLSSSAILNASGSGSANYSAVIIYPTGSGYFISGDLAAPLIDLNGTDNVTIDGRVNATGSSKDLVISNISGSSVAGTSTIRFINDATSNTVQYCTLKGSSTDAAAGIIYFSTTTGTTGNDGNTITKNDITNAADTKRPLNAIYSLGAGISMENSGITISDNNIFDFLNRGTASEGINVVANNSTWSITGNSFYETSAFTATASAVMYCAMLIGPSNSGIGFIISGNFIGGNSPSCGGTWTKTNSTDNTFYGIYLNVGSTFGGVNIPCSVQNNTIANFAWSNSNTAAWYGIYVNAGNVNVGTTSGNTIGASTGTGSIIVTGGATGSVVYGIYDNDTDNTVYQNNTIGSITAANAATNASNIYGIYKASAIGTTTISNNTIGSASTANSVNASSICSTAANAQSVYGISAAGTATITINGNTIANLTNGTTNGTAATAGVINGIASTAATINISNNTIHDLTIANRNTSATNTASACGIALSGATLSNLSGNTIYNLSNSYATFIGNVIGIYYSGGTTGMNTVSGNFIYNLSVASATGNLYGIKIATGATTYSNNIISLGGNTTTTIYGIYETGAANNNNNLYFNTVYIGGVPTAGALNSYALYSAVNTNTRDFRNNIFDNARSNSGATGKHYAAYFNYAVNTNLTLNYNDYYAPGTNGVLGFYNGADKIALPIVTGMDANSQIINPNFAVPGGTTALDYYPSATLNGVSGTGILTDYSENTRGGTPKMGALESSSLPSNTVDVYIGAVLQASYTNLRTAFDKINDGTHTGSLILKVKGNNVLTAPAVLNASGVGNASYTDINIYPTVTGLSITGNLASPLIDFDGADNVTLDGRVNATGSTKDLTISNASTSGNAGTSTIRFIDDASSNTIKYCKIKGSSTDATGGILYFSTTSVITGNDGNTIDNNDITNSADANRPLNAVYSLGTSFKENSGNTISNNNIFDFLNRATASNGIYLSSFTTGWTISGNSFFEINSFTPTAGVAYNMIFINNNLGYNFTVTGNYIGGSSASCGGTAWTKLSGGNNAYNGIWLNVAGSGNTSNVQNNTIKNIIWNNSGASAWTGINIIAGDVNIGTITGNTIGDQIGTGSITCAFGATGASIYGINIASPGTVVCQNNTIGSITGANAATSATNIYGINKTGVAGTTTISNNTIGSNSQVNSINANSVSTGNQQNVYGVYTAGTGSISISGNTISNLTNGTTNATAATAGTVNGVVSVTGLDNTISNNVIHDLKIANANNTATNTASVCGIALSGAILRTVSGNTIYNLSNTNGTFAGSVIGLYFSGSTGANVVSGNFIHSLSVASALGTLNGIKIASGATTYSNNIINLGGNTSTIIYGIYDTGAALQTCNLYFNTVYIGGLPTAGAINSYALYSLASTNTRDFRNNLLVNARSNTLAASGTHYAAWFNYAVSTNLTLQFNDYNTPGTGGILGRYNGLNVNTVPLVAGLDDNSLNVNPVFAVPGGTTAANYIPSANSLIGNTIAGVSTDYAGTTRAATPTMGAFEGTLLLPPRVDVYKTGVLQASYFYLKDAFDKINNGTHTGVLEVRINQSTYEPAPAVLYQSSYTGSGGPSSYTSVKVFPTVTGITVKGNLAAPLIELNGATNVTIDGRVNATGSTKDMSIINTNTSATAGTSTIRFINDASSNTVKYCTLKGSTTDATGGIINFGTTSGTTGNDNNTIDSNNITNALDTNRPLNAVYSLGTATRENAGNTISNNNIYDFLNRGTASNGINIASNSNTWSIIGNSFYETASFVPTASVAYMIININNASGTGFNLTGNYIGGKAALCLGTAWTKTNAFDNLFYAIQLNVGSAPASSVQNNTIQNFTWGNSLNNSWMGIYVLAGDVNIGTTAGNTIGAITGTGSISVTNTTTLANVYGININSAGTIFCQNNKIGSITGANAAANGTNIYGIFKNLVAGTTTISNNTIGSTGTPGSINSSSVCSGVGNAQSVYGIFSGGSGLVTINGNTIANLTNGTTNGTAATAGVINGIVTTSGSNTISNNTIYNLTIGNANTSATNSASVSGIAVNAATLNTITGNTIYNLSNSYATFAGNVNGLFYSGPTTGTNTVAGNFIYGLSVASTTGFIYGINIAAGATTYSNNIISLTVNTRTTIYGIYETGTVNNNNLYFNTVYIAGTSTGGALNSYALRSNTNANTRDFRNNIFYNARSNTAGTAKHYAAFFNYAVNTSLTLDYNDYFAPGIGGWLGNFAATDVNALPIVTAKDANSLAINPNFALAGGTVALNYYPAATLNGITGTGILIDYNENPRGGTPKMGALETNSLPSNTVDVFIGAVLQASYTNLRTAFDKINDGTHTGSLILKINGNNVLTAPAVLNASGTGSASYSAVNIYPTVTGLSVTGNLAAPLIDLNGADNITIDGRVNGAGSTKDLVISNTSPANNAGTSTIRFINDASSNTVKYCKLKGSSTDATGGIINFSTTTITAGNDGSTIDNNDITNSVDANRPLNAVYSLGTATKENTGNTISNNNIFDFLNRVTASNGITFSSNTTACSITGNSFYETASFVPTAGVTYNIINIANASGNSFSVTGNYIGGSAASCGSTAWTKTNAASNVFYGIQLNAGSAATSDIQNNTIKNFAWSNSTNAAWYGIFIGSGNVNIGTGGGNIIGASSGTGSVTVTGATTGMNVYGIYINSPNVTDCQNNTIGSITGSNSAVNATSIYGIYKRAFAGTTTIKTNAIGSATANSINATSTSTGNRQSVYGIYNAGTGTITIDGNTISNLTNATTNGTAAISGAINGITSVAGTNSITNNTINDLKIANANNSATNTASVSGIALSSATDRTISGNTIYNLSNTYGTFAGNVIGLYYSGSTGGSNAVSVNFIHSLTVTGASSTTASLYGIKIASGATTYFNNIINLGGNTATTLYGIYETGASGNNNNLYFNTVYIGGVPTAGTLNSYALYSAVTTNIRNFRNNIFDNARSNSGATGKHYGAYFNYAINTNLTLGYNDYYAPGTGGVLGYYNGADVLTVPLIAGLDAGSLSVNPSFTTPGGTAATDYKVYFAINGVAGTGITTDYGGFTRKATPTMGAWDRSLNKWKGSVSTNWNTPANWLGNILPAVDDDLWFDDAPLNHCQMDQNRSVTDIYINQATYRLVTNGQKLTVKGNLNLTNGAQIDASASGSTAEFAGSAPQAIPSGAFFNNEVYNLTVNNSNNLTFNGTLRLLNTLATTSGLLDASTNSPTFVFAGAVAQTIEGSRFLNEQAYNLVSDNATGVTLNTDFTVTNSLTINSGKIFAVAAAKALTVSGTITNSAGNTGFVLQSDASGTASLLHNTNNVAATVNRYISGSVEAWHFLSSPVAAQSISGSWLPAGTYGNGTGYDLYVWDETTSCWIYKLNTTSPVNWNTVHPGGNFVVGRGYLYSVQAANPTKQFAGNLNNGSQSIPVTSASADVLLKGFNLVGNPYPSSIDWQASSGWTRSCLTNSGGGYNMWIWNPAAGNYGVINSASGAGTNSVTRYIAPMQGFFVLAASAGNLDMDNTVRVHTGANDWKSATINPAIFSLKVHSDADNNFDEVQLEFGHRSNQAGAKKLFSPVLTAPSLYIPSGGTFYSVQYLTDTIDYPTVPVMFKPGRDGKYILQNNFDLNQFNIVILEDLKTHTYQDLKNNPTYQFTASKTDDFSRFVVHFTPVKNQSGMELQANIYMEGNNLIIDLSSVYSETDVSIYDVLGRKVLQQKLQGGVKHSVNFDTVTQLVIVSLQNKDGNLSRKILLGRNQQ